MTWFSFYSKQLTLSMFVAISFRGTGFASRGLDGHKDGLREAPIDARFENPMDDDRLECTPIDEERDIVCWDAAPWLVGTGMWEEADEKLSVDVDRLGKLTESLGIWDCMARRMQNLSELSQFVWLSIFKLLTLKMSEKKNI